MLPALAVMVSAACTLIFAHPHAASTAMAGGDMPGYERDTAPNPAPAGVTDRGEQAPSAPSVPS